MAVKASVEKSVASLRPSASARVTSRMCSTCLRVSVLQPVIGVVAARCSARRCVWRFRSGEPCETASCATTVRSLTLGLNAGAGKQRLGLRNRACAGAGPSSRSRRRGRRRGCRRRSASAAASTARACTMSAKVADGLGIADDRASARCRSSTDAARSARRRSRSRRRQAEARAEPAGNARADDRVVLVAPLADVVQEGGHDRAPGDS